MPPGVAMIQRLYDRKSLSTIFQKFLYLHIYPVMFANCSADENFKKFLEFDNKLYRILTLKLQLRQ